MSCGYALSGLSPSPAVRLVPMNTTVCAWVAPVRTADGTARAVARTESVLGGLLAFAEAAPVAAGTLSSAFERLHASGIAIAATTISDAVQRPRTSLIILMLVARHLTKQYRSGE